MNKIKNHHQPHPGNGLPPCFGYIPPNFLPWLGICPVCKNEQMVSAYNVRVACEFCDYKGWRDDYKD